MHRGLAAHTDDFCKNRNMYVVHVSKRSHIIDFFFFLRGLKKNMKQIKYATMLRQENQKHNDRGIHALHV